MLPSGATLATPVVVVKIWFNTARASTDVSADRLLIAAIRSCVSVAKLADMKLASWVLRAFRASSTSPSIEVSKGANCAALGRRAIEATAVSRRDRSGSKSWNCTKAVPIKRRTPPLGLSCLKSDLGAVVVAWVSTSVSVRLSPAAVATKKVPSLRCQMFFSDHCSKKKVI